MIVPNFFKRGSIGFAVLNTFITLLLLGARATAAAAVNITTAGAGTYTAAQVANGFITRDPAGAARTDTTDTAANLITALKLTANGHARQCLIQNTADADETITLAGGTGVTLKGAITIEQNTAIRIEVVRTSATTVCVRQV